MNGSQLENLERLIHILGHNLHMKRKSWLHFHLHKNSLNESEMYYRGKFGHTLVWIQHIYIMRKIDICYTAFHETTQNVSPKLPGFQGIKRCVRYLASHPNKPIFYLSIYYDGLNVIRLTWSGNKMEDYTTHNFP